LQQPENLDFVLQVTAGALMFGEAEDELRVDDNTSFMKPSPFRLSLSIVSSGAILWMRRL